MEVKLGTGKLKIIYSILVFNSVYFVFHIIELIIPTAPRLQGKGITFKVTDEFSSELMIDEEDLIYDENKIK